MTHPSSEALLLFALGRPLARGAGRGLEAHVEACPGCGDRVDAILAARFEAEAAAAPAAGRPQGGPHRAAAAATRTYEAPAPPLELGRIEVPGGPPAAVFRRSDAPEVFALDRRDLAGRALRLSAEGHEPVDIRLDRFGRFRLAPEAAEAVVAMVTTARATAADR
jgi:hypothetical protein